ncbi:FxSxx-COOH system tetratricopeptide repeat protein [Catellatospora sichuanensis]|uniref:FxSxx-COOH system tetratricopeptide repeat protein n=1 Tax=Catellatospora sichuanensis TaxID=1969805 RepID=UPI0011845388|nr:FxSxx-COOH system tetratricopeptide repeat protein [Catellatospora sichuanensis]
MQISRPSLDAVPLGSFRDLVDALHDLYRLAGCPSARVVSGSIYDDRSLEVVSHETYRHALRGTYLLSWMKYHSIIVDLNRRTRDPRDEAGLTTEFLALWNRAREGHRPTRAGETTTVPISRAGRGAPSPPRPDAEVTWPVLSLPDRNSLFTGRRPALGRIRKAFEQRAHTTVVLHGVNGAGKTQLAAEYAHRYGAAYPIVWWIRCNDLEKAQAGLAELAGRLGLGNGSPGDRSLAELRRYLGSPDVPNLLIFDGVEGRAIRGLIPTGGGHVILTTTDRELAYDTTMIEVEVLDFAPDEAHEFLGRRLPDITEAQRIDVIDRVGRLPLDLDLGARQCDPAAPHVQYAPSDGMVTALAGVRLGLSAEHREVCDLFGWFGPAPVPIALLQGAGATMPAPLGQTLRNPFELRRALRELANYGFIRVGEDQAEMTQLARQALRRILSGDADTRARHHVHEILARAALDPPGIAPAGAYREIGVHVQPAQLVESRNPDAQRLVADQIRFRVLDGDLTGAAGLARQAVTAWRQPGFLASDHDLVLRVQVELADTLRGLGEYTPARDLSRTVLRHLQTSPAHGPDHELTFAAVAGTAADLLVAGEYAQAVTTGRDNHSRCVAVLGAYHARTVACRRQLATGLRHVGAYAEAVTLDLPDYERLLAADNALEAAWAAFALAEDHIGLGRYDQALTLLDDHVPVARGLLGDADPGVLAACRTAAVARRRLGRPQALAELRELHKRCTEILDRADAQLLAGVKVSYANALRDAGGTVLAEQLITQAAEGYRTRLTDRHPLTMVAQVNLAAVQRARGRWQAARDTGRQAAEQLDGMLGASHPYAISAAVNHATDLALTGDRTGAVEASRAVYATAVDALGPGHPTSLAAGTNLALDLVAVGAPDDELRERTLAGWQDLLGEHEFVARWARGSRVECDLDPIPI